MQETKKQQFKRHVGYGVGFFPDACFYNFISAYQLLFLTSIVGMDAGNAGTIIAITIFADGLFSVFVGRFSDNLRSRFGRRRPLILFGAIVMPICYLACFFNFQASPGAQMAYYLTFGFLYWMSFAVFLVAFLALGADIATDYDDRIRMLSTSRLFSIAGDLIGSAAPLATIAFFSARGLSASTSWFLFVAIISVLVFVGAIVCWNSTRGKERVVTDAPEKQGFVAMARDFGELLKLKPYRILIYSKIAISFTYTAYTVCTVFYVVYKMGISSTFITPLYLLTNLSKLGFVFIVTRAALKYGKKELIVVSCIGIGLLAVFYSFYGINTKFSIYVYIVGCVYVQAMYWQLSNTNFYDVTDLDEYRYAKRREGNLMALQMLICTTAVSVTLKFITGILEFSGFDATLAVQSPGAIAMLERIFILFPAIGMIACAFFMSRYRVNKRGFMILREFLYRQEQGLEQIGQEEIEKIEYMFK